MVTGTEGYPGLSGLASCPEAALVTLDTKAGGEDMENQGLCSLSWPYVDVVEGASAPQDKVSYPWRIFF